MIVNRARLRERIKAETVRRAARATERMGIKVPPATRIAGEVFDDIERRVVAYVAQLVDKGLTGGWRKTGKTLKLR